MLVYDFGPKVAVGFLIGSGLVFSTLLVVGFLSALFYDSLSFRMAARMSASFGLKLVVVGVNACVVAWKLSVRNCSTWSSVC